MSQRGQAVGRTCFEALLISRLHASARSGALVVNPAGDLASHVAHEMSATHWMLFRAGKADVPRRDLHQAAIIESALIRLAPVERHAVVCAASTAGLAGVGGGRHAIFLSALASLGNRSSGDKELAAADVTRTLIVLAAAVSTGHNRPCNAEP